MQAVGLSYGMRTTPDVSFNADPNSGVAVYDSVGYSGQSGWFQLGGTSASAPAWAALIAIADQGLAMGGKAPLSGTQAQTQLYALPSSDFHDHHDRLQRLQRSVWLQPGHGARITPGESRDRRPALGQWCVPDVHHVARDRGHGDDLVLEGLSS